MGGVLLTAAAAAAAGMGGRWSTHAKEESTCLCSSVAQLNMLICGCEGKAITLCLPGQAGPSSAPRPALLSQVCAYLES